MASYTNGEHTLANYHGGQLIAGLLIPAHFDKKTVKEIFDFMPDDEDVIIASYPKTGSTWVQYIVNQILTEGESFPSINDLLEKVVPFLEMYGVSSLEAITTRPRVYKHHIPYNMMKKNPKTKIIYTYRKPEDKLVSLYHIINDIYGPLDIDKFFEDFMTGEVRYGCYFQHIRSYLKYVDHKNLLFVSYEKLQAHRKAEILRIAKFIGEEHYSGIKSDKSILYKIIKQTSFDYMKSNLTFPFPKHPANDDANDAARKEIAFFRKGIIGDGKNYLNGNQLYRLRKVAEQNMQGSEILKEWYED